ncbi:MAG: hypothetical protein IBV53_01585 [Candidatus Atribacteria bacterium]
MKITHKLAQNIVDKTMSILERNINIMDENGVIIGSGDRSRLNQYHEGAAQVIKEGKKLEIYSNDINHLVGAKPGINLPIEHNNKIIGVVGITGEPNEVSPFGEVIKMTVERIGIEEVETPKEVVMDILGYINDFKSGYEKIVKPENFFLPVEIISSLDRISKSSWEKGFVFPVNLWAKSVFCGLSYYEQKKDRKEDILEILRILWQGHLASFGVETKDLGIEESEEVIQQQVEIFKEYKEKIWQS